MGLEILDLEHRLGWRDGWIADDPESRLTRIHARLPEKTRVSFGPKADKPSEHIVLGLQKAKREETEDV